MNVCIVYRVPQLVLFMQIITFSTDLTKPNFQVQEN